MRWDKVWYFLETWGENMSGTRPELFCISFNTRGGQNNLQLLVPSSACTALAHEPQTLDRKHLRLLLAALRVSAELRAGERTQKHNQAQQ